MKPTLVSLALLLTVQTGVHAQQRDSVDFGDNDGLIPRNLLRLVHAPEVHSELSLSDGQVADLERLFSEIDSRWFSSRIRPQEEQSKVLRELESRVWDWFGHNTSPAQVERLQQLEYYSQAGRVLLRDDVANEIGLPDPERKALAELARRVEELHSKLRQTQNGDDKRASIQDELKRAVQAERQGLTKHVQSSQRRKLSALLGEPFDTTKLKRIYPMAPEFATVKHWINSPPLQLSELRGNVLLVHFYAFQCHNCHANFDIYKRWHEELYDKGVRVIGIQTPETRAERNAESVGLAAEKQGLEFPILVDLESKNWKAWGNTMWPTVYVIDKNGYIRFWWQGELNWKGATSDQVIEDLVGELLEENS